MVEGYMMHLRKCEKLTGVFMLIIFNSIFICVSSSYSFGFLFINSRLSSKWATLLRHSG